MLEICEGLPIYRRTKWNFLRIVILMPSYVFSSGTPFFLAVFFDTNKKYNTNTQIDKRPLLPEILTTFSFAWSTIPFLLVFCVFHQNCNHGSCQSNTMQTLVQWRHPVASSEALVVIHWAMRPALHRPISMVIKIVSNFPASFCIINFVFSHNRS